MIAHMKYIKYLSNRTVYYSTENIESDICQYSFRFQSHLHPKKNNNTTQCLQKKTLYSDIYAQTYVPIPPYNTKRNKFYFFTIHIFCIVLSLLLIFNYVLS